MCYNVVSATRILIKYAKHRQEDPEMIKELEDKLKQLEEEMTPNYQVSGFEFPRLLVFTDAEPEEPNLFNWGLIPSWVKDAETAKKLRAQTLNARKETLFEKPAFRTSAKNKRCLVYIDAFYEHHHYKGKTYPFHIAMKNGDPFSLAGIWEDWVDRETGELLRTVSIITTEGNKLLSKIHNNPKLEGPRMPVILPKNKQDEWLIPYKDESTIKQLEQLLIPFNDEELEAYTVHRLKGKESVGNVPEAEKLFEYEELKDFQ
jgi:putative SOS response-associated peptidase YedK